MRHEEHCLRKKGAAAMLSAYNRLGEQVVAWEAAKEDGPFSCPECGQAVVVKKGFVVAHHFAHVPPSTCQYGAGESVDHWLAKYEIYEALRIHALWMPLYADDLGEGQRYAPHYWEKYLHALHFGKVYYWLQGATILPVHFDEYRVGIIYHRWYDRARGVWVDGRYSKRYRTPTFLERVGITDLQAVTRGSWQSGPFSLPAARLWCLPPG